MSEFIIQAQHIGKQVNDVGGELTILQDISFEIGAQESVAIIGASGSGKSTLLSIMAGLDTPTSGQIKMGDLDFFQLTEDERAAWRAAHMGFVFQSFQLLGHLTALENVMLPLELAGQPHPKRQATEMLERVGLAARSGHYPNVLSGGEQQRVALARAFVMRPQILLADEPTGSLDAATGERIMDLLFQMNAEQGTTLVLVTHDEKIANRCQRRFIMNSGYLEEEQVMV